MLERTKWGWLVGEVTVLMPTHDRRDVMRATLDRVLGQREVDFEVLIVDDASTDGTAEYLAAVTDPRIRVVSTAKGGASGARNAGLREIQSRWVAFCDDDDLWHEDKLASQMAALRDRPDAAWSFTGCVQFDERQRLVAAQRANAGPDLLRRLLSANVVPGGCSSVVVRADVLARVGSFDERLTFGEDWDLWIRLAAAAPCVVVDEPLVAYRVDRRSASFEHRPGPTYKILKHRYAHDRAVHGSVLSSSDMSAYHALLMAASGRRFASVGAYSRAAVGGNLRYAALAAACLVSPERVHERNLRRTAAAIPPEWAGSVRQWLPAALAVSDVPPTCGSSAGR